MQSDVSLCVVRIETSKNTSSKQDKAVNLKKSSSVPIFRGRRETTSIKIETLSLTGKMAEAKETTVKPVSPHSALEKVSAKSIIDGKSAKEVLQFVSGNPYVEKLHGIIHLFKEDELTQMDRAVMRSQTLCIIAIPSTMNCADLLTFLSPCKDTIKHIRIIRDNSPNQYMALITFRSPEAILTFYSNFNGMPFNSLEPEWCCHLVFVSRVEALSESDGGSIAPTSHTELPVCPVCLERMDESVDGILTILCNHAFHGNCLEKWVDTTCPVCRYVQTPEPTDDNRCLECMAKESLWICLICGHVGCGRYLQGHAYQHYLDTHHCYSMQLGSNSVWDYVGDNFVHRILQNKADGKLVETSNHEKPVEMESKLEAVQLEYTYLLTSQLESQRTYYEGMIVDLERKLYDDMTHLKGKLQNISEENRILQENNNALIKEKQNLEKKLQVLSTKLASAYKQLQEEKELSKAMCKNQTLWQEKYNNLEHEMMKYKEQNEAKVVELKEQLRDIMFYLEAKKTVDSSPHKDELKEGTVEIQPAPPSASTSKGNRRRKH